MDFGDAGLIGVALAIAMASLRVAEGLIKKVRNGGSKNHPTEEARISAKLDSICTHTQTSASMLSQLVKEQRTTSDLLNRMCLLRGVDEERHKALCSQLDRIENKIE